MTCYLVVLLKLIVDYGHHSATLSKMPQYVFIFLLTFVVPMHHVSTKSSYGEHHRKLLQSSGMELFNSSSQLKDIDLMSIRRAPRQIVHVSFYAFTFPLFNAFDRYIYIKHAFPGSVF